MTPKERVRMALNHEEPDRVPWGGYGIDYDTVEHVLGRQTYYRAKFRQTKATWDGKRDEIVASMNRDVVDLVLKLGLDLIETSVVPKKGYKPEALEPIDHETYRDKAGNLFRVSATTETLMLYQRAPRPNREFTEADIKLSPAQPWDASELEMVRYMVEKLGRTHFIAMRWGGLGWPHLGFDEEESLINLKLHPEWVKRVTKHQADNMLAHLDQIRRLDVDAVFPGADYSSNLGPMASPELYREAILPEMKRVCAAAHDCGYKVIQHACGNNWALMDMFVEAGIDGYQAIQGSCGMDMKLLKGRYRGKMALWGGVWTENLVLGAPESVRRDVLYSLKYAGPGGGLILGPSHSFEIGTKPENVAMMKRTLEERGRYPIRITEDI